MNVSHTSQDVAKDLHTLLVNANVLGPYIILTHRRRGWSGFPEVPPDIAAKLEQIWQDLQIDLASLSSKSAHIIATEAGHNIHVDEPQLVIDAILKVMAEAKK